MVTRLIVAAGNSRTSGMGDGIAVRYYGLIAVKSGKTARDRQQRIGDLTRWPYASAPPSVSAAPQAPSALQSPHGHHQHRDVRPPAFPVPAHPAATPAPSDMNATFLS